MQLPARECGNELSEIAHYAFSENESLKKRGRVISIALMNESIVRYEKKYPVKWSNITLTVMWENVTCVEYLTNSRK